MAKHIHRIIINSPQSENEVKTYKYDFGRTKNVKLSVSQGYLCVEAALQKIYDKQEMFSQNQYLFPDAIKKALLIHLVLFSEQIVIHTMFVQVDNEIDCILDTAKGQVPPLNSMVVGKLIHPFSVEWDRSSIDGILTQTKSTYDSRTASLFALIYSKCKHYESERFIYLWLAFNGMYNHFAQLISETHGSIKIKIEYKQLRYFQRLFHLGDETISTDADKNRIAHEVAALIKNESITITQQFFESENGKILGERIQSLLVATGNNHRYNLTPYGYLLTQFSYYYRCNLFHANKPLALFSFTDESEINCLRVVNSMLEDFIERNLTLWFDNTFVDEQLRTAASTMSII